MINCAVIIKKFLMVSMNVRTDLWLMDTLDNVIVPEVFGIGGGIPITPFGSWSYDFTEEQATELLADCPDDTVLISHSPPKNILDRSSSGLHLGSEVVRKVIMEKNPRLVVCGHIHESSGRIENYENTVVINAGPEGVIHEI